MHFRYIIILYTYVVVSTRLRRRPMTMCLSARRTGLSRELLTYVYVIIVVVIYLTHTPRTRTRRTLTQAHTCIKYYYYLLKLILYIYTLLITHKCHTHNIVKNYLDVSYKLLKSYYTATIEK